jgi:hypothetical protein
MKHVATLFLNIRVVPEWGLPTVGLNPRHELFEVTGYATTRSGNCVRDTTPGSRATQAEGTCGAPV